MNAHDDKHRAALRLAHQVGRGFDHAQSVLLAEAYCELWDELAAEREDHEHSVQAAARAVKAASTPSHVAPIADSRGHERRVVGHASGWQEQMDTCICGKPWPCPSAVSTTPQKPDAGEALNLANRIVMEMAHFEIDPDEGSPDHNLLTLARAVVSTESAIAPKAIPVPSTVKMPVKTFDTYYLYDSAGRELCTGRASDMEFLAACVNATANNSPDGGKQT